jgi:chaperone modulatory protein CbpM
MYTETEVVALIQTVTVTELRGWVHAGWVAPVAGERGPQYDELDVARIRLVCQLRGDLEVPDDAVPMVLSLLDQVHGLRRELRALVNAVEAQPAPVRDEIRSAFRSLISTAGPGQDELDER